MASQDTTASVFFGGEREGWPSEPWTATMRTFDDLCLTPIEEFTPQQIHDLRLREHASQAVFARYLNVTPSTVSQWERGEKRPRGPSLKLLTLVAKGGLRAIA